MNSMVFKFYILVGAILPTTRPVFNLTTISFTTHHYNDTTHNTIVTIPAVSEITSSKPTGK